jgi:Ca-activated chloride channel family protein
MTFLAPAMLWFLLAVPLLVAGYVLLQRRRKTYVARFTNLNLLAEVAPRRPGWRRHVAAALLLGTLVVLLFALARPAVSAKVPKEQASIVLVLDVSRSMAATDLSPDRMTAAKRAATDFVRTLPTKLRVGVVAFSDSASVVSPLGRDRAQTTAAIASLAPIRGTAIGEGLDAALGEIRRERAGGTDVPAAVLLLSDGASNQGRPSADVAAEAADMKVPVYTVGVGTEGATLEFMGRVLPVDLDEQELHAIAEITGAQYFRTTDAGALRAVYRDLGSKLGFETEQHEATAAAAGIAAILLLGAAGASLLWFQRIP